MLFNKVAVIVVAYVLCIQSRCRDGTWSLPKLTLRRSFVLYLVSVEIERRRDGDDEILIKNF